MSNKYKINNPDGIYFLSTAVVNWIDVFTRRAYKDIVIDSLKFCIEKKGLLVYAYVIMSNHIHLIIRRTEKGSDLSSIIRDFKKYTSSQIIEAITNNPQESRRDWILWMLERAGKKNANNKRYQFWQQDNHPIELEGNWIDQKLEYVHQNPVEMGIVREPEDYKYFGSCPPQLAQVFRRGCERWRDLCLYPKVSLVLASLMSALRVFKICCWSSALRACTSYRASLQRGV